MDPTTGPIETSSEQNAEHVLRGAEEIAEFIFGDRSHRRKIYYLAECSKVPIYRLGSTLCMRPSTYRDWVMQMETRSVANVKRSR